MKKAKVMYIPAGGKKAVWGPIDQNVLPEGYPYVSKTENVWTENEDYPQDSANVGIFLKDENGKPRALVVGRKYRVIWDGVEYISTAFLRSNSSNIVLTDNGTEEASVFEIVYTVLRCFVTGVVYPANHTFSVYEIVENVERIDPKYLPEGYPYKEQSVQHITWDGNTEGLTQLPDMPVFKVSDVVLTASNLIGQQFTVATSDGEEIIIITEEMVSGNGPMVGVTYSDMPMVGSVLPGVAGIPAGTYLFSDPDMGVYVSDFSYMGEIAHPMAVEYMPKMVVNVSHEMDAEDRHTNFKADKTYAEIRAAADAGYIVEMHMHWFSDTGDDGPLQVLHYAGHYDMVGYPNQPLGFISLWPLNHYNTSGIDGFRAILQCYEDGEDTLECKHFQFDVTYV